MTDRARTNEGAASTRSKALLVFGAGVFVLFSVVSVGVTGAAATPTATPTPVASGSITADWWYEPLSPLVNETVRVAAREDEVTGYTYEWDVDDDGNYELRGRTAGFHFDAAGDHNVTFRVTGPGGQQTTKSRTVTVDQTRERTDGPASDGSTTFLYTPLSPQNAELVTLIALPSVPVDDVASYGWDLDGDGTVDANGRIVERAGRVNSTTAVELYVKRADGSTETVVRQVPIANPNRTGTSPAATGSPASATTGADGPGFGAVIAIAAIALCLAGVGQRRSQ